MGRWNEPRAEYKAAGEAMRAATARLHAIPRTSKTSQYRDITMHVIVQIGSYSRIADELRRKDVAEAFGVTVRTVSRAMEWAASHGVLSWAAGKAGSAWVAGLTPRQNAGESVHTLESSEEPNCPPPLDTSTREIAPHREDDEKKLPPSPHGLDDELVAALGGEGISPEDIPAVIAISAEDPETFSPTGRLTKVPGHRKASVERFKARQRRQRASAREAEPKCGGCDYTVAECDEATARQPDRCDPALERWAAAEGRSA